MRSLGVCGYLLVAAIGVLPVTSSVAREIYKWVGRDGATHYSEQKPEGSEIAGFEALDVNGAAPAGAAAESAAGVADYRAALELARQLQADRLARERVRLERQALRLKQQAARREAQQTEDVPVYSYVLPYGAYPHRPPHRHWPKRPPDGVTGPPRPHRAPPVPLQYRTRQALPQTER